MVTSYERKLITIVSHRLSMTQLNKTRTQLFSALPLQINISSNLPVRKKTLLVTLIKYFLRLVHSLLSSWSITYRKQTAYANKQMNYMQRLEPFPSTLHWDSILNLFFQEYLSLGLNSSMQICSWSFAFPWINAKEMLCGHFLQDSVIFFCSR